VRRKENSASFLDNKRIDSEILDIILQSRCIRPVYQPVVSLSDGKVFGYEALSRISNNNFEINIEQLFVIAVNLNRVWELEKLCRTVSLEGAVSISAGKKLFLNVDPNIINDDSFKSGFTKRRLQKYGMDCHEIIFEITERVAVNDNITFMASIHHYKSQNYGIALDDVGAGYSGLKMLTDVKPNFIKLDVNLIRDIDKDEIKQHLCKAMSDFGKNSGIKLIAEGIEAKDELETLIKFGVDYGQGYYLAMPNELLLDISPEKRQDICKYHALYQQ
jgi:EAL domain-containing protein (putative c-di-GMP-specific phosphodiesterase class I)